MRSKAEIAALERVFDAARQQRDVWRADAHCDVYVGAINRTCEAVDAAEAVLRGRERKVERA